MIVGALVGYAIGGGILFAIHVVRMRRADRAFWRKFYALHPELDRGDSTS